MTTKWLEASLETAKFCRRRRPLTMKTFEVLLITAQTKSITQDIYGTSRYLLVWVSTRLDLACRHGSDQFRPVAARSTTNWSYLLPPCANFTLHIRFWQCCITRLANLLFPCSTKLNSCKSCRHHLAISSQLLRPDTAPHAL